jgi:predicted DCC family thiol-disulfide oxidoreductase YuxK
MTGSADNQSPLPTATDKPILLFDAVCVLCSGWVRFILARERGPDVVFASVQSPRGQALLAAYGLPLVDWDSNVFIEHGRPYFKTAAFFAVLRYLRWPWPWLRLGLALPTRPLDWLYDRIARNRYRLFGRYDVCVAPEPGSAHRFLT